MAQLTLQSLKIVSKYIQGDTEKIPVLQINYDFGQAVASGDSFKIPSEMVPQQVPSFLTLCAIWARTGAIGQIFPDGVPSQNTDYGATTYNGQTYSIRYHVSGSYTYQPFLYRQGLSDAGFLSSRIVSGAPWQSVGPAFLHYDVVGEKYFGCTNGLGCYATSNVSTANVFGVIKTNTLPQYVPAGETYTWAPASTVDVYVSTNSSWNDFLLAVIKDTGFPDPYEQGGVSEENLGGNGTFDGESDTIEDSTAPTISCANTGFTRIFNPTLAQVQALANYLWTDTTFIGNVENIAKKLLENPMDAFIAFNLVPCAVPDGGLVEFKVLYIGTGVNMTVAASQFVDVDCGTLSIDEYYGSALDYSPNTKVSVFLPFIGTVQLDTDDVMGKTIGIKYRIDIVSGGCVAKIVVDGSIHYQYSGHCAINIPFTSADYTGYISAMLQAAKIGATIASSGAAAGAAALEEGVDVPSMVAEGKSMTDILKASDKVDPWSQGASAVTKATFNSLAPKNISNTVNTIMASKPVVERSGSFSGNTGYLGIRRPFCIIERPRMCNPSDYGKYNGRPAMITMNLGDCSGFTKVQQVQLTGIPATNPELDEIGAFLKGGVVL